MTATKKDAGPAKKSSADFEALEAPAGETLEMPPKKKLPAAAIALLERWVAMGAPWPKSAHALTEAEDADPRAAIREAGKKHWAFQPLRKPPLPEVRDTARVKSPVDRFVLARLEAEKIPPSPRADDRTLMRRAWLDLVGMPPSPEKAEAFLAAPDFDRLVDTLLDDPGYGERWGRHWLDVARYADSKGAIFGETQQYPYAYAYRDYVIAAFNDDKPFDRFVREQLAADMIPGLGKNDPALAGLGFLTVHRRSNAGGKEAQWADRVDTVGRGLLGLTLSCASCHDHKYDPVSMSDYYALYGVFASIEEPEQFPVIGRPDPESELARDYQAFLKEEDRKLQAYIDENHRKIMKRFRGQVGDYLLAVHEGRDFDDGQLRTLAGRRKLNPTVTFRWRDYLKKHPDDPVFALWHTLAALPSEEKAFAAAAAELLGKLSDPTLSGSDPTLSGRRLNPVVSAAFRAQPPPASLQEAAERYQAVFTRVDEQWTKALGTDPGHPPAGFTGDADREALRRLLYGADAPGVMPARDFKLLDRNIFLGLIRKKADRTLRLSMHPGSPRRAMVVRDKKKLYDPYIYIRGNKDRRGDAVNRRFIELLGGGEARPFTHGSGRLELAEAIVAPDNPLTARVIVNRVWAHHFGSGLVKTPSDFGLRAEPPSHPDLLDWLASDFIAHGWSIKRLHRLIMGSAAYQQTSRPAPEKIARDPDNRLLWRFNRRRLEYEAMRDSMLAVSGKLDPSRGGPATLIAASVRSAGPRSKDRADWQFNPYRRTVYAALDRDKMPAQMQTFDFSLPDETTARRDRTTVPTQGLFMMNAGFPMEMARGVVERLGLRSPAKSDQPAVAAEEIDAGIGKIYRQVFSRAPTAEERAVARTFIEHSRAAASDPAAGEETASPWQFGYTGYDHRKVTHDLDRLQSFPYLGDGRMQGGAKFPDEKNGFGWLQLRSTGGHAGGVNRCQVRRWISPVSGTVDIGGELSHRYEVGDGIRATIYRNRGERLGQWTAHNRKVDTGLGEVPVEKGDIIDFVIDCVDGGGYDGFDWNPLIVPVGTTRVPGGRTSWSPKRDFPSPPEESGSGGGTEAPRVFGPWEQFAQVLLISNEFVHIE